MRIQPWIESIGPGRARELLGWHESIIVGVLDGRRTLKPVEALLVCERSEGRVSLEEALQTRLDRNARLRRSDIPAGGRPDNSIDAWRTYCMPAAITHRARLLDTKGEPLDSETTGERVAKALKGNPASIEDAFAISAATGGRMPVEDLAWKAFGAARRDAFRFGPCVVPWPGYRAEQHTSEAAVA